jgi:hypothetical protein
MKSMTVVKVVVLCCIFLLVSFHEARAGDYSVAFTNDIKKTTNEAGSSCSSISINYWSGTNGKKVQSSSTLGAYSPQTLTIKNAGACSSLDITATCHYWQTSYTNYGKMSQYSSSYWVYETKTQSFGCCHNATIGLALTRQGDGAVTLLNITCQ